MQDDSRFLENSIKYEFRDKSILRKALTHPSCALGYNYERLEFLGDAVLELIISDCLYNGYPTFSEGVLTQKRAEIVCAKSLAAIARTVDLGRYIYLGKGEEHSDGRNKPSILENVLEALLGAVYEDGGFYSAKAVINELFSNTINNVMNRDGDSDYKSQLQEMVQKTIKKEINYLVSRQEGPPHNTTFYVRLIIGGDVICEGIGSSKKEAEQNAAKFAISNFDNIYI